MTSEGNYVALGVSYSTDGDVSGNAGNGDYWAVEFNGTGAIIWERCFGGSGPDRGQTIRPDPSFKGLFMLVGDSSSVDGDVTGNHGGSDYWVVKLGAQEGLKANFRATPLTGTAPLSVRFTDLSGGEPTQFMYEFGDGFRAMGANPAHTYRKPGMYSVTLTVSKLNRDERKIEKDTVTKSAYIIVTQGTPGPFIADFTASPTVGTAPLTVRFTDTSSGDPLLYLYRFGDGTASRTPNPLHTYRRTGTYPVTLTVWTIQDGRLMRNTTVRENFIQVG